MNQGTCLPSLKLIGPKTKEWCKKLIVGKMLYMKYNISPSMGGRHTWKKTKYMNENPSVKSILEPRRVHGRGKVRIVSSHHYLPRKNNGERDKGEMMKIIFQSPYKVMYRYVDTPETFTKTKLLMKWEGDSSHAVCERTYLTGLSKGVGFMQVLCNLIRVNM